MMTFKTVQVIILMTIVTYGVRVLPLILLRGKKIDGFIKDFIELVPVALLAALIIPDILFTKEFEGVLFRSPYIWAALSTFVFARFVPNLFWGVLFGMLSFWGFDLFLR